MHFGVVRVIFSRVPKSVSPTETEFISFTTEESRQPHSEYSLLSDRLHEVSGCLLPENKEIITLAVTEW